jgi:glycosidase
MRQRGTSQIEELWSVRPQNWGTTAQPDGIGVAPAQLPVNFLDNHDVPRFLFSAKGDVKALRNALTLLMTEQGLPCLYYGTELELSGGNDPANREVVWARGFDTSGETYRHFAALARVRAASPALRLGSTRVLFSTAQTGEEPEAGLFAFERAGGDAGGAYALVVLNTNGRHASRTQLSTSLSAGTALRDALGSAALTVGAQGRLDVEVPAQSAFVLLR